MLNQRQRQCRNQNECQHRDRESKSKSLGLPGRRDQLRTGRFTRGQSRRQRVAAGQCSRHSQGGLGPLRRVGLETAENDVLDNRVHIGRDAADAGRAAGLLHPDQLGYRVGIEGATTGEEFVGDQPECVNVTAGGDRGAAQLLRRLVGRRAAARLGALQLIGDRGEAEVHDHDLAPPVQHHVVRLEIAVDDASLVRRRETGADFPGDLERLIRGQSADALQERREVLSIDEFHRDEGQPFGLPDVIHAADVRV